MLKLWRTVCNAVQNLTGLGFELSTSGYNSKYCSLIIYKLEHCTAHQNNNSAIARTVNFHCLFNKTNMTECLDLLVLNLYAYSYAI